MILLAELSAYDPPIMIGVVLGCLMFILVGGNAAAEFWRNIKGKSPEPPNEHLEISHRHLRNEFDKHVVTDEGVHKDLFHKLGGVERGVEERLTEKLKEMAEADKTSRGKMHDQISELSNSVSALEAKSDIANQRIVQFDSKLDRIIERTKSRDR